MNTHVMRAAAFVEGTPGAEIVPELRPAEGEHFIKKRTLSPFASTDLLWWLNKRGVDTLALAGVVTHYAVLSTAISAYDMGFNVVVLRDCCMSGDIETHDMALGVLTPLATIMDSQEILRSLS